MPGYHNEFPQGTAEKMAALIKQETDVLALKRIQCIYLRSKFNYSAKVISEIVGFHKQTVLNLHSRFLKVGELCLELKKKGGRMRANMSLEEEIKFLETFEQDGDKGQILEVSSIKSSLEAKLKKEISKTSVYELLHRHGWRKIAPRAYHPKRDQAKQEDFKKTFPPMLMMQRKWLKLKD